MIPALVSAPPVPAPQSIRGESCSFVVIAIVIIVVAAAALVASSAKRRDLGSATGQLSRETLKRDATAACRGARTGRRRCVAARRSSERPSIARSEALVPASSVAPTLWIPPDPETIGVTRRQFLNRSIITMMGLAHRHLRRRRVHRASSGPRAPAASARKIRVGKITDLIADIEKGGGFLYKPEGRMWLVEYPDIAPAQGPDRLQGPGRAPRHGDGHPGALPEVRAPRLPCPVVCRPRSGSSARVTARSTTRSARRRAARRLAARPLRDGGLARRRPHREHRRHHPGPADRYEHHRSGSPGTPLRVAVAAHKDRFMHSHETDASRE